MRKLKEDTADTHTRGGLSMNTCLHGVRRQGERKRTCRYRCFSSAERKKNNKKKLLKTRGEKKKRFPPSRSADLEVLDGGHVPGHEVAVPDQQVRHRPEHEQQHQARKKREGGQDTTRHGRRGENKGRQKIGKAGTNGRRAQDTSTPVQKEAPLPNPCLPSSPAAR